MFTQKLLKFTHQFFLSIKRHEATLINGKSIANKILAELSKEVKTFSELHHVPSLTVLQVGENPASELYIKSKINAAKVVGIKTNLIKFPSSITENDLLNNIRTINDAKDIDAVLLQLPLPPSFDDAICQEIVPEKDVDGFTETNFGRFCLGLESLIPCTALAVQHLLREIGTNITGKNIVVCGRSKHVGLPIAMILHSDYDSSLGLGGNVTICHQFTPPEQLESYCREADILISATGMPSLIRGHMIKKGAIVIDVGITRIPISNSSLTKIVGDVDFDEAKEVAGFITPVPGGVGPMTVAMLMKNTLLAAKRRINDSL